MKTALRSLVVLVAVLLSGAAPAETWPTRPIKFVVPFGPGIGIDIMARTVADRLSHKLGQPVIVENIPGAGNILGAQAVARAAPDGYTFLFTGPSPVVTNIFAFKSLPYDPYRDFTAVAMISDRGPFVISVNPEVAGFDTSRAARLRPRPSRSIALCDRWLRDISKCCCPILCQDGGRRPCRGRIPHHISGVAGHRRRVHRDGFQLGGGQLGSCRAGEVEADCDHLEGPFSGCRGATDSRGNASRVLFRGIHSVVGAGGSARRDRGAHQPENRRSSAGARSAGTVPDIRLRDQRRGYPRRRQRAYPRRQRAMESSRQ